MSDTLQPDVIVKNGLVVEGSGVGRFDIAVADGKISAREIDIQGGSSTRVIDAKGMWVLPGILDVHYHPMYGDDLAQGSIGAAYGGVTTMIPFVYAYRGMELEETIDKFIEGDGARSTLDFGIHIGILDPVATVDQIPKIFKRGVNSLKMFMAYRKRGMMAEDNLFLNAMEIVAGQGGLMMVHAENGLAIDYLEPPEAARVRGRPPRHPACGRGQGLALPGAHVHRRIRRDHPARPGRRDSRRGRDLPPVPGADKRRIPAARSDLQDGAAFPDEMGQRHP
ncbi:MAG: hypothetical protein QGF68_04555, partial [Nitrospinota bacterium]|nr:hypothetical protein [Nitrospinota bacterium]